VERREPAAASRKMKTPARKRGWGSLVGHGGDNVPDQRSAMYSPVSEQPNYKSVMVTDKASQGRMASWAMRKLSGGLARQIFNETNDAAPKMRTPDARE
jgi:hypothetical protein